MRLVIGCILTLVSGFSMGLCRAYSLRSRVNALVDFLSAIEQLRTEISFAARPLGDCLCALSGSRLCKTAAALPFVHEHPQRALAAATETCFANADDRALALEFAAALGSSDVDSQLRTLDFFAARIRTQFHTAEQERTGKSKLSVYLGLCGAAVVCILFT